MGLSRVFGLCAALLFTSSVSAAVTIDLGPSDWRRWGDGTSHHHTRGLNTKFGQTVRMPPMNTSLTVTRNAVVPYGSIANGLRQFVRVNPASIAASAAVTGLFLAVDWVFDEATGEWRKEGEDVAIDPDPNAYHWYVTTDTATIFSTPLDACRHGDEVRANSEGSGWVYETQSMTFDSATFGYCRGRARNPSNGQWVSNFTISNIRRGGNQCPVGSTYNTSMRACVMPQGLVPLTSADWSNLESQLPALPASEVGEAAGDAMQRQGAPLNGYSDMTIEGPSSVTGSETTSTSTDPVTGDTVVTTTQTTTNISYGDTTITTTNTTTTNTYTNGTHTSTEVVTETPGELPVTEPAVEWPGFCDWAGIVCDWIGWTQEEAPDEPDLPQVIDDDFYEEKSIQFGSKTCPPDYEISIPFINSTAAVPMQPLCDFAGIIYYMVMAAAYVIAAYITVGVVRNG